MIHWENIECADCRESASGKCLQHRFNTTPTGDIPRRPYVCPVCAGHGMLPPGFYDGPAASANITAPQCRSCFGRGVVWG